MSNNNARILVGGSMTPRSVANAAQRRFDRVVLATCIALLAKRTHGRLTLTLPSGERAVISGKTPGVEANLCMRSYSAFRHSLRRGALGFAEAFMRGECDSSDLKALFHYFLDNRAGLAAAGRGHFRVRARDRGVHAARANTKSGSRDNITAHYDLGNDFYAAWLDTSLSYSSALFTEPEQSLEQAQRHKIERVIAVLDPSPQHRVLEIGCGWGALAAAIAEKSCHVTGLTLSTEQHRAAVERLALAGLAERTDIRLQDYRDVTGSFDRIVSIEMIEAVGEDYWPVYFQTLHDRLTSGGVAVVQAITIDEDLFETYRRRPDFIQRYIFPGGMLPTRSAIAVHAERAGLVLESCERFGASYAQTLAHWRQRFHASWPALAALGFDDQFRRMWDYYLAYCEAGFEKGTVDVESTGS